MKIEVLSTYKLARPGYVAGQAAVVVDALRASATIATAIAAGCDRIIPVENTERAMEVYRHQFGELLLGGESGGVKIPGFDLGNSPLEYDSAAVADKVLVYCTTNGTRAIHSLMDADTVLIGSLINAAAVSERVRGLERLVVVCAGSHGRLSIEDFFAAGAIIDRLLCENRGSELDDAAHLALATYRNYRQMPGKLLAGTSHYERLIELGFKDDIDYCLKEDILNVVPSYNEGIITK